MHGTMPTVQYRGMLGIGDCLFSRAVLREARARGQSVWLHSHYSAMFHDLIAEGIKVIPFTPKHKKERIWEREALFVDEPAPAGTSDQLTYNGQTIKAKGSVLAAQFHAAGLKMPERPDFSLPVPAKWREWARAKLGQTNGKPLLVYRPIVLNDVWKAPARSPDPEAYRTLFKLVRDSFHVVSIADLNQKEWFVGDEQDVDTKFHHGELSFEELTGLFAEASLVFGCAGFAPVLAQAVRTPSIVVYGGNESFRTTNMVGAHLAPTLAIEPINPCECHSRTHDCDKRIDMAAATAKIEQFMTQLEVKPSPGKVFFAWNEVPEAEPLPRTMIFGTTYVDTEEKHKLIRQWAKLHHELNPRADFMLVDSASPVGHLVDEPKMFVWMFADNIGHLSKGGKDGWGRAFCQGLEIAIERGFDYVVHIEGDSLFRLPVEPIIAEMRAKGIKVASVPVGYGQNQRSTWVETGLMFFDVAWLKKINFIERYDWPHRTAVPQPEVVIRKICGDDLVIMPWKAERADKDEITADNVLEFDWVTHVKDGAAYDRFVENVIPPAEAADLIRLNFGCGTNKLAGWANYDREIDISRPLPFATAYADFILAEHVVEHVEFAAALRFFKECRRVLKPGGVARIAVPSIEQVWKDGTDAYFGWVHTKKWAPTPDARGAMDAILHQHGHRAPWTASVLASALYLAGFDTIVPRDPGLSDHAALRGVEGHGRVIGDAFNAIETIVCEAS